MIGDRPPAPADTRVLIVGAGIAGLTTALSLARLNIRSIVAERAPAFAEVGSGIQLSPNALRVLDRFGCLDALRSKACQANSVILRDARNGRSLARVPVSSPDGTPYLSIHRADLQTVLASHVDAEPLIDLRLGHELASLDTAPDGVDAGFEDRAGKRWALRTHLLVGADGVNSEIARQLDLAPPRFTGAIAWRGTAEGAAARRFVDRSAGVTAWLDSRRHAVAYPIRSGEMVNLVLVSKAETPAPPRTPAIIDLFSFAAADLRELIAEAGPFTPWPLFETPSTRAFAHSNGRVVLVGDAAHAMLPYAAQGAAMAIEDGFVLARHIANERHAADAAPLFEADRRARIDRVRGRVRFHRFVYHLPRPLSLARNAVMAMSPEERLRDSLGWLYDWQPPEPR